MKKILLVAAVFALAVSSANAEGTATAQPTKRDITLSEWAYNAKQVMVQRDAALSICKSWSKAGSPSRLASTLLALVYYGPFGIPYLMEDMGRQIRMSKTCKDARASGGQKPVTF